MSIKWLAVLLIFSGSVSNSFATLIIDDPSQGFVRDDRGTLTESDDQYWIRDFTKFANRSYGEQLAAIDAMNQSSSLSGGPWGDWRMAQKEDILGMSHGDGFFYEFFQPSDAQHDFSHNEYSYNNVFYFGRIDDWSEEYEGEHCVSAQNWDYLLYSDGHIQNLDHWNNGLDTNANPGDDVAESWLGAWVVADYLNSVPEPPSLLLFSAGILGVAGIVMRKKNKGSQV